MCILSCARYVHIQLWNITNINKENLSPEKTHTFMHRHAPSFLISKVPDEKRAGSGVQTHVCSPQAPRTGPLISRIPGSWVIKGANTWALPLRHQLRAAPADGSSWKQRLIPNSTQWWLLKSCVCWDLELSYFSLSNSSSPSTFPCVLLWLLLK